MKKKIILVSLMMLFIVLIGQVSYAAVAIVPGGTAMVNITATNSYLSCRNMKNTGESLYGTTVEPHMATNKDWGAVSYLSNSSYGTNTAGGNTGVAITIDGTSYYSTNGNITGIMNWGSSPSGKEYYATQTAGLVKYYLDNSTNNINIEELENEANNNSKFVEIIDTNTFNNIITQGMAMTETSNLFSTMRHSR